MRDRIQPHPQAEQESKQVQQRSISLHHTDKDTRMISTTCSTTEMVTQGKLQISDSDNIEGKRLASLLNLFINMLVWAARLPNAPITEIIELIESLIILSAFSSSKQQQ